MFYFYFWQDWALNLGLCTCKAGALPLKHILLWLLLELGSSKLFAGLSSNSNPPDFSY
jgi:hypothetical protein